MRWTAIVPLKLSGVRKSRLADLLPAPERARLADALADHVLDCLSHSIPIERIVILSPEAPHRALVQWRPDAGNGVNVELQAMRRELEGPLIVINGDLPLLAEDDVAALCDAAVEQGAALAPDRHDVGTNAIACLSAFEFAFGPSSFARHRQTAPGAAVVKRIGLALDIDTPDDLRAAFEAGWGGAGLGLDALAWL